MTLLGQRFTRLSDLPHLPLANATRVHRLGVSDDVGGELWVKRDDETSPTYGGNKVRKLEFLLGEARRKRCESLLTTGAFGSHHVLATSLFGARWGFEVHAVLVPQPWTEHVRENLRCTLGAGTEVHAARAWPTAAALGAKVYGQLQLEGRRPFRIPHGGSSVVGTLGEVDAGLELAEQIEEGALPTPRTIYLALGSGGTAAGLAVGLAAAGLTTEVRAVRVTPRVVSSLMLVRRLIDGVVRFLREFDPGFPDVARGAAKLLTIDDGHRGAGYGAPDASALEALERASMDGLELDTTYTAKAYDAFLRAGTKDGPRLFWNTLSSADLSARLAEAPHLDERFAR
ncbi:MAG: pyridoxal-phosphate dependent enzyme [Myxococcota bacterium]